MSGRKKALVTCAIAFVAICVVSVLGTLFSGAATTINFDVKSEMPSATHPFGTDWMGRDMLLRTVAGLRLSIFVGCITSAISSMIALLIGCLAGANKHADSVISWVIDLVMGIPHIILLILISYALSGGMLGVCVSIALTHWPNLARIIRAEVLQCKCSEYVKTSNKLGCSWAHIARTHIFPYVLPQFITGAILMFPHAILHEATLTFLGFGLSPETPAIGVILSEAMSYLSSGCWWLAIFPGAALVCVVMLFSAMGKNLQTLMCPNTTQL